MSTTNGMTKRLCAAAIGLTATLALVNLSCKEPGAEHGHSFGHGGGHAKHERKPLILNADDLAPSTQPAMLDKDPQTGAVFPRLTFRDIHEMGYNYPPAPPSRPVEKGDAEDLTRYESISVQTLNANCTACHSGYASGADAVDWHTMHPQSKNIACVDCHGGDWRVEAAEGIQDRKGTPDYDRIKNAAHVLPNPKTASLWMVGSRLSTANPEIPGALTLAESPDYIRFVNPGDLHAARAACFNCHAKEVETTERSMMAHGGMLWGAALYNNGAINVKDPIFGESYTADGKPRALLYERNDQVREATRAPAPPTVEDTRKHGVLPFLFPLPRWEISQPGNVLRVFERGGKVLKGEIANPNILLEIDPGRPDVKLSTRGFGTQLRTDPVFIGLQKTRLLDPTLNLFGTNDHPGDYRASGCTACHVVYANDRSPVHSARWSQFGNRGYSHSTDPNVPKDESGHPINHKFVKSMPTSTCIVCHIHPGTLVLNSYLGFTWWDNETDGELMYPRTQKYPTGDDEYAVNQHNPEQAAVRGLWSNRYPNDQNHLGQVAGEKFLERTYTDINPQLKHTQFADFHGHGWIFRAVYKQDSRGNLLNHDGQQIQDVNAEKLARSVAHQWKKPGDTPPADVPVHLKDIHLEMGMHCVDCHFLPDVHGDGNLYGEARNATAEECVDCHGSPKEPAVILQYLLEQDSDKQDALLKRTWTGNSARTMTDGMRRRIISTHFKVNEETKQLIQVSAVEKNDDGSPREWVVRQTIDAESGLERGKWNDDSPESTRQRNALYAHTVRRDGKTWGVKPTVEDIQKDPSQALAHDPDSFSCYACHTSWTTSCFGCHLPMRANWRKQMLHNEGMFTRNYTNYNFQTLRDDVYMLGIDGSVKGNKVVPIRSACAVLVSSQDALRNWLYVQQQTVSAEGFSGQAFSPYFPHTVRTVETKQCSDCHISDANDNNARMAQLLLHGTNAANFIGRFAYVAAGKGGLEAVGVAERDEPQAVIGSRLHETVYPDWYRDHQKRGGKLHEYHTHHGNVLDVQLRGEYVYAACGEDGVILYDVANIDNKGFSERILTAPVSPLGQRFYVKTRYATSIVSPTTLGVDPTRPRLPENEEGRIVKYELVNGFLQPKVVEEARPHHLLYAMLYATDKYEGLVVIGNPLSETKNKPGVATLLDGDPDNNFIGKALSFNPGGVLNGARSMTLYGHYAYICADAGLFVVNLDNPLQPQLVTAAGVEGLKNPRKVQFQFRYGFVVDDDGLKAIDVTDPQSPKLVGTTAPLSDARDVYLCRTYAYVANGKEGLAIVDIGKPLELSSTNVIRFNDNGGMNDSNAVKVGMTNNCLYAYVADGKNGLKVLQLTDASLNHATPGFYGFSPLPVPRLIAHHKTHGPALAISEGLDRDRAVDESGHQLSVFGRRGARPFDLEEQQRLYLKTVDGQRQVYTVSDRPSVEPLAAPVKAEPPPTEGGGRGRGRGRGR